jgi:hypothetical protein
MRNITQATDERFGVSPRVRTRADIESRAD